MKLLLLIALAALLAGCDAREGLVEKCVAAQLRAGNSEATGRMSCMRAAYGHIPA